MKPLCRIGLHRYRTVVTGDRYTPNRLIRACTRRGLMHPSEAS